MQRPSFVFVLALCLASSAARATEPVRWSVADEARMAAEAASWAPPDFKRQLAKHSRRLMQGVADAAAAERLAPGDPAHRAAAAKGARGIAAAIRRHVAFADVAYDSGILLHAVAMSYAPGAPGTPGPSPLPRLSRRAVRGARGPRRRGASRRDGAPSAGPRPSRSRPASSRGRGRPPAGDASIVKQYPDSKGPYQP